MPRPTITLEIADVYDNRHRARTAAEAIAEVIGNRRDDWVISITEDQNTSAWLIRARGEEKEWSCEFDGTDQAPDLIESHFRLQLGPYLSQ